MAISYVKSLGAVTTLVSKTVPSNCVGAVVEWTTIPDAYSRTAGLPARFYPALARVWWGWSAPLDGGTRGLMMPGISHDRIRMAFWPMPALATLLWIEPRTGVVGDVYWMVDAP